MTKKKLVEELLDILEKWERDHMADLDGHNGWYFDEMVEILKEEEKRHECKV